MEKPHQNLINNWSLLTRAKVGAMLMDIVEREKKEEIEIDGITALGRKYHIGDKTFTKYLKKSIFQNENKKGNNKFLYLSKIDIILIREMIYLEKKYQNLQPPQKKILSCLLAKL